MERKSIRNSNIFKRETLKKSIIKIKKHKKEIKKNYGIAEAISKIIIDRIIREVPFISRNNTIEKTISNYYFNFMNNLITPLINMYYFNYENCENSTIRPNADIINNEDVTKTNTWIEILEPPPSLPDRFDSIKIKLKPYKKGDNVLIKNNSNIINELIEYKKININTGDNKNKNNKIDKIAELNEKIKNLNKIKKLLKRDIPSMVYCDLEKEKYENIFSNETLNEELRKEKNEKDIIIMELNNKNNSVNKKGINDKKDIKPKNFDGKALSFDPNGNIIKKISNKENILKKDFHFLETKIKNTKLLNSLTNEFEEIDKNNIFKNINKRNIYKGSFNNSKTFNKKNIIVEYNNKDNTNDNYIEIKSEDEINNNKIKKSIIGKNNYNNIKPEIGVIVKSEDDSYIKEGGNNFLLKYNKPSVNDYNNILYQTSLKNRQYYLTSNNISGNNLTSYNNINTNTNNITTGNFISSENNVYNGYNQSFNEKNNPLIVNALSPIFKNIKIKRKNILFNNNNSRKRNLDFEKYIKKSNSTYRFNSSDFLNLNELSSLNSIKLSNITKNRSLFNIMSDYNSDDFINRKNSISNSENKKILDNNIKTNILSYKSMNLNSYKEKKFPLINKNNKNSEDNNINKHNIINKFNYRIMMNKNWGKENDSDIKEKNLNKSNFIKNYFRKPNLTNRIKIINEKRLGKINTRKRNIHFLQENSTNSYTNYKNLI